jgi:hypothetical protein
LHIRKKILKGYTQIKKKAVSRMKQKDNMYIWDNMKQEHRDLVLKKVYCGGCCRAVEIADYRFESSGTSLVLRGKCKKCGHEAARVLEGC